MIVSRRAARILAASLLIVSLGTTPASAAPGDVDTTFADVGLLTEVRDVTNRLPIVPGPGGAFVVAWSSADPAGTQVGVSGYLASGTPDGDYGAGGSSSIEVPGAEAAEAVNAVVDTQGRVVVVGFVDYTDTVRMFVARFTASGDPDASFSDDGVRVVGFAQGEAYGYGIAVRKGAIYIAGQVYLGTGYAEVAAVRLTGAGELSKVFGNGGRKRYDVDHGYAGADFAIEVVPTRRGRLVLAGGVATPQGFDTLTMRIRPDGRRDRSFQGDGVLIRNLRKGGDDYANDLAKDGARLVLGIAGDAQKPKIMRLRGSGAKDPSFGTNGVGRYPMANFSPFAVAVDAQHRVLVVGFNVGLPVLRVEADGSVSTFGVDGVATNPATNAFGSNLLVRGGSILVSGRGQFVVTRYLSA